MSLNVILASRGRSHRLVASLWSLWSLASKAGRDNLRFHVGVDDDDIPTHIVCQELQSELPIMISSAPRPKGLGEVHNRLIAGILHDEPVSLWSDRLICLTPGWDQVIMESIEMRPDRAAWWMDRAESNGYVPIFPARYLNAIGRTFSTGLFPFWGDDQWHLELDCFISRESGIITLPISYGGMRGRTTRARDFKFWFWVFRSTRPERLRLAEAATQRLGREWDCAPRRIVEFFERNDKFQSDYAELLEADYGDPDPPDAAYFEAKERAEQFVHDLDRSMSYGIR